MKKFITDQSREMTAAVDMIGFIQIGDDGKSINTTSLNLLQIVAECDEIVIDGVDVLMMINVVHDYLKDNYRMFDDCK